MELIMELEVNGLKPGTVHTVQTLAAAEPGLNEGGIRWTIFQHKSKLVDEGAIFYVGKKLLIDRDRYVSLRNTICNRPVGGDPKSRQGKIHEHDIATAHPGYVQPRPTGACTYIQEAHARP